MASEQNKIDLQVFFPNLNLDNLEDDPEFYPVVLPKSRPDWYSLFPRLYPDTPTNVIEAYQSLFTTGEGPDEGDIEILSIGRSNSTGSTASTESKPVSTTTEEFNPGPNERYKDVGLTWYTSAFKNGLKGIKNSCNIDGYVTNLAIQFSRSKYDFEVFVNRAAQPDSVENFIIELIRLHKRHKSRKTSELSKKIKQMWVDTTKIGKLTNNGRTIDLAGSESDHIFTHFREMSQFWTEVKCKCGTSTREKRYNINVISDKEVHLALDGQIRDANGDHYSTCETCTQKPKLDNITIPPGTWMLHFCIDKGEGKKVDHRKFPSTLEYDGVEFFKSYSSYWTPIGRSNTQGHTVSLHFIKGQPYYYDDVENRGVLYHFGTGPMNKKSFLQHIVYLRRPPLRN
jgi:hypothetical protein